jgi:hypothetical protein
MKLLICSFELLILFIEFFFLSLRSKEFDEKSLLSPNAVFEKAMIYIDLKQKQKANEYLQKSM